MCHDEHTRHGKDIINIIGSVRPIPCDNRQYIEKKTYNQVPKVNA